MRKGTRRCKSKIKKRGRELDIHKHFFCHKVFDFGTNLPVNSRNFKIELDKYMNKLDFWK